MRLLCAVLNSVKLSNSDSVSGRPISLPSESEAAERSNSSIIGLGPA